MSNFTDSHCHISNTDDISNILRNAETKGVIKFINNGCDYNSNKEVLSISKKYNQIYCAIGFHPQNLENFNLDMLKQIEDNITNLVAIGEIGLDYHYENCNKNMQKEVFENQMKLAKKYCLPVIVHVRDATQDCINILKKYPEVSGVIHCFSGSEETANEYIKLGYKLGIGGVVTFKNSKLGDTLKNIDVKNLVLETDSPYLTPEPKRGSKNEPANIFYIAYKLAEIKNITLDELSKITEKNIETVFDI